MCMLRWRKMISGEICENVTLVISLHQKKVVHPLGVITPLCFEKKHYLGQIKNTT